MDRRSFLTASSLVLLPFLGGCGKRAQNGTANELPGIERLDISDDELRKELAHVPAQNIESTVDKVRNTIDLVRSQKLPQNFPNWIAYHSMLMYRDHFDRYRHGENTNENVKKVFETALNSDTTKDGPFVLRDGLPHPRHAGPYFMQEHHPDQFLHYFSMADGTLDAMLKVDGKEFTMGDVLKRSKLEARTSNELAYTVLVYTKFVGPDESWQNKFAERISLAIILKQLLERPELTCLGTHRISALARVYENKSFQEDRGIKRLWPELERQVLEAVVKLKRSQREDGGFEPPGMTPTTQMQEQIDIYYGGHALEWLSFLGDEYMSDDWVVRAFEHLCTAIERTYAQTFRNMDAVGSEVSHFDFDGLCHATSALDGFLNEKWSL